MKKACSTQNAGNVNKGGFSLPLPKLNLDQRNYLNCPNSLRNRSY